MSATIADALKQTIIRLKESTRETLFEKVPDHPDGLNAAEINRLAGRTIFEVPPEEDGKRRLIVQAPDGSRAEWTLWGRGWEHFGDVARDRANKPKLDRTLAYLEDWLKCLTRPTHGYDENDARGASSARSKKSDLTTGPLTPDMVPDTLGLNAVPF
jgi:hypothetical protein